jgi:hypothetical protein
MHDESLSVRMSHLQCDNTPQTTIRSQFRAIFTPTNCVSGRNEDSVQLIGAMGISLTGVILPAMSYTQTCSNRFKKIVHRKATGEISKLEYSQYHAYLCG